MADNVTLDPLHTVFGPVMVTTGRSRGVSGTQVLAEQPFSVTVTQMMEGAPGIGKDIVGVVSPVPHR